jgi:hypothetical protein
MEYWYDIVKSYDDPKSKNPEKGDDGTYSQFSVVMLLIYLAFGRDYPYNIAKNFDNLSNIGIKKRARSSILWHKGRIATLLNKMREDGLVVVNEEIVKSRPRKYYKLNPKILQSPVRDGTYFDEEGSVFNISLDLIERYLSYLEKYEGKYFQSGCERRDEIFQRSLIPDIVDYFTFLYLLEDEISLWIKDMELHYSKSVPDSDFPYLLSKHRWAIESSLGIQLDPNKDYELRIVEWR